MIELVQQVVQRHLEKKKLVLRKFTLRQWPQSSDAPEVAETSSNTTHGCKNVQRTARDIERGKKKEKKKKGRRLFWRQTVPGLGQKRNPSTNVYKVTETQTKSILGVVAQRACSGLRVEGTRLHSTRRWDSKCWPAHMFKDPSSLFFPWRKLVSETLTKQTRMHLNRRRDPYSSRNQVVCALKQAGRVPQIIPIRTRGNSPGLFQSPTSSPFIREAVLR